MRFLDPVVLTGADAPSLLGCKTCVEKLVAFAWIDGEWMQAPVQVDERHVQDFFIIKNGQCHLDDRNMNFLVYSDPNTYSGSDEDPSLDEDDEIVFMAKDVGTQFNGKESPEGVVADIIEELEVIDPINEEVLGYMYLFISDGSLDQGAGTSRIEYNFNLTKTDENGSNNYFDVYDFDGNEIDWTDHVILNPEDSYFQSQYYQRHFAFNWNSDNVKIFAGESTGEDLMAHQDFQFSTSSCGRCVYTFGLGYTGFIANKAGPVRAIRSWVGANSGAITQRESIMYEQREDLRTFLRVHPVQGVMDYVTYKQNLPLTYYNCKNKGGILIDGKSESDSFNAHYCPWEYVTGRAGSFLRTFILETDVGDHYGIPNDEIGERVFEAWFYDNEVPETIENEVSIHPNGFHQCSTKITEQKAAWGTHGYKVKDQYSLPNSDPNRAPHEVGGNTPQNCFIEMDQTLNRFDFHNNYYYLPPGLEISTAEQIYQDDTNPLAVKSLKTSKIEI